MLLQIAHGFLGPRLTVGRREAYQLTMINRPTKFNGMVKSNVNGRWRSLTGRCRKFTISSLPRRKEVGVNEYKIYRGGA